MGSFGGIPVPDQGEETPTSAGSFSAPEKPKLRPRRVESLTGRSSNEPEKKSLSGFMATPMGKTLETAALVGTGAGVGSVAGSMLKGAVRPALGLGASFAVGAGVDKLATRLGAPPWVAEALALAAAAKTGERIGLTPEMRAKIKISGAKGLLKDWLIGGGAPPEPSALEAFWQEQHPGEPFPPPGQAREQAGAELKQARREIAQKVKDAAEGKKPKLSERATGQPAVKAGGGKGTPIHPEPKPQPPGPAVKAGAGKPPAPMAPDEQPRPPISVGASSGKPKTTAEKIEAGRTKATAAPAAPLAPAAGGSPAGLGTGKPAVRISSVTGSAPAPRAQGVSTERSEQDIGRFASNFARDRNAQMGDILRAKGYTPDQVLSMSEDEFYAAVGGKDPKTGKPIARFRGKLDASGKAASQHRTFEQGRNDVAAWMLEQGGVK